MIAVPAIAFLVSPLRKKKTQAGKTPSRSLASLSQLKVGVPRSFAIIQDQTDAWIKYPSEPVGSVWLIRQPAGAKPEVIAFTAECPHLGCAINLSADGKSFLCPCHTSAFNFEGKPENQVPPRPMDRLDVELSAEPDPEGPRQVPTVPDSGRGEDSPCLTTLQTGWTTGPVIGP